MDLNTLLQQAPTNPAAGILLFLTWPFLLVREVIARPNPGGATNSIFPSLPKLTPPGMTSAYQNEEIWEWKDYKGRDRKIVVHRDAKRS